MSSKKFQKGSCPLIVASLLLIILPNVFPANILFFFPGGNFSHKSALWPWVLELAKRGHNVTFLSPHGKAPQVHPNISDMTSPHLSQLVSSVYQVDRFKDRDDGTEKTFDYNEISVKTCELLIENRETDPVFSNILMNKDSKFDLIVVNALFGECGFYIANYLKAKVITYNACTLLGWSYETYGVGTEAAWIPDLIFTSRNIPIQFLDRVQNVFYGIFWSYGRELLSAELEKVVEPLFKPGNVPTLYELENNISFVLLNAHPSTDFARTLPPMFIDVGGLSSSSSDKELPKDFKEFMDTAGKDGVILITFGSTVLLNTVTEKHQAMFFHLFDQFPNAKFLMRWSGPLPKFLDKIPNNLMVSEWLPQKEILAHPNLKLFITHGGISSIQESTYNGVPMIVLPLFADQDYNAYRIEALEVGVRVEIRGMTENSLVDAVGKILSDDKYKNNMMKKSAIFRDRPLNPVDTAVFWTEFALRHNDTLSTFRPYNHHLNWFQRRLLDAYAFITLVIILLVVLPIIILKFLLKLLRAIFWENSEKGSDKRKAKKRD